MLELPGGAGRLVWENLTLLFPWGTLVCAAGLVVLGLVPGRDGRVQALSRSLSRSPSQEPMDVLGKAGRSPPPQLSRVTQGTPSLQAAESTGEQPRQRGREDRQEKPLSPEFGSCWPGRSPHGSSESSRRRGRKKGWQRRTPKGAGAAGQGLAQLPAPESDHHDHCTTSARVSGGTRASSSPSSALVAHRHHSVSWEWSVVAAGSSAHTGFVSAVPLLPASPARTLSSVVYSAVFCSKLNVCCDLQHPPSLSW